MAVSRASASAFCVMRGRPRARWSASAASATRGLGGLHLVAQRLGGFARRLGLDLQIAEPVLLGEPPRGGGGRLGGLR